MEYSWFKEYYWFDFYQDSEEVKPLDMSESRVHVVTVECLVDTNHAINQADRRRQTRILTFLNKVNINFNSKQQPLVQASTFGAEFFP